MALKDVGKAFGGAGSAALVVDLVVGTGQLLATFAQFFAGNAELFLAFFATISGRLAPELAWLPADLMNKIVLGIALLYVAILGVRLIKRWQNAN